MGIIRVLDTELSNKIAAGEVVERPASVVKELVENSIDAHATAITVEITNGGVSYIRVSDNGKGMSAEDAKICFLRHATSKIVSDEDLNAIYTLGFRGEALSSIGAVARVSLYTKQKDGDGICVTCCGGEILSSSEAGIPNGTGVIVEGLFYNTPARLKFLKKDATEAGYITDIITRFIFAHPEISFKLIVNGKDKLFSPGDNSLKNSIYTAYGKDYANGMLEVDYTANGIRVSGLVGKGNICRPNRNYQSYFVNGRYIKSAMVIRAVEDAYKNQIMIGKFPVAVLNIEIAPELMDINVHPTKLEVKFANERDVRNAVYYGVKNALYALPNVPEITRVDEETGEVFFEGDKSKEQVNLVDFVKDLPQNIKKYPQKNSVKNEVPRIKANTEKIEFTLDEEKTVYVTEQPTKQEDEHKIEYKSKQPAEKFVFEEAAEEITEEPIKKDEFGIEYAGEARSVAERYEYLNKIGDGKFRFNDASTELSEETETAEEITVTPSNVDEGTLNNSDKGTPNVTGSDDENIFIDEYFRIIGQVFDTYILVEKDEKLLMVDQHAAHERLQYEELKRDLENKQVMSQIMLEPVIVKMTPTEFLVYEENKKVINEMGFDTDPFGDSDVIVRGVPGELEAGEIEGLLIELVTNAANAKHEIMTEKYERMLYTIACKAAIKANHRLSEPEMEVLVRNVFRLKNINTCPHGRPIIISMTKKEIEKEFKRIT